MENAYNPELIDRHVPREATGGEVRLAYLRPGQLLSALDAFLVAYVPLGTLEWHGRQNPLGCDMIKAARVCEEAAKQSGGVVLPPIYLACDAYRDCGKGMGLGMDPVAGFALPGSFYPVKPELFREMLIALCRNLLSRGVKLVILVAGHNPSIQRNIASEACFHFMRPDGETPVAMLMEYDAADDPSLELSRVADHAAGYETSMMLYLTKNVRMDANDGMEIPDLAVAGEIPYTEATADFGEKCFRSEARGLALWAKARLATLERRA